MALFSVECPHCKDVKKVVKFGTSSNGKQRYLCQNPECSCKTFLLDYSNLGRIPRVKQKIIEMVSSGSSIRNTARVLGISPSTVVGELKKKNLS